MIDNKLLTFLTLLEEKSYTKTAERLFVTQPNVTHHIKSLEKEYDIKLFINPKTFELTKSGSMLLEYAKSQKMQEELLMSNLKKQDTFVCDIGFTPMVRATIPAVAEFSQMFGTLPSFNAYCYSYHELAEMLACGKLDFAFVDCSFDSQNFDSILLTTEKLVLVGKPDGQYKGKDRINRELLSTATLVCSDKDSGLYRCVAQGYKAKNIRLKNNYLIHSNDPDLMKKLILMTDGLSFMYYDTVKDDIEKGILKKFEIQNLQFTQNIYVLFNKSIILNETLRNFIDMLSKVGK